MALIGAILVEIKIIEILCERSLREGDRYALNHGILFSVFLPLGLLFLFITKVGAFKRQIVGI